MKIKLNAKIGPKLIDILKRETAYADFALDSLNQDIIFYEKKYSMSWKVFLSQFEKGEIGDNRDLFKLYALVKFTQDWYDTKKEIGKALRDS